VLDVQTKAGWSEDSGRFAVTGEDIRQRGLRLQSKEKTRHVKGPDLFVERPKTLDEEAGAGRRQHRRWVEDPRLR